MHRSQYKVVSDISGINEISWKDFVKNHPSGTVFHLPGFYHTYKETRNYKPLVIAVLSDSGEVVGILLSLIQHDYFFPFSIFTKRSVIFGGPIAKDDDREVLILLLETYERKVKGKVIYSQIRNLIAQNESEKNFIQESGYQYEEHLNILINTSVDKIQLWKEIKRNRKDGINKAKKQGFIFKYYDQYPGIVIFSDLVDDTYRGTRIPHPHSSLYPAISQSLAGNIKWFELRLADKPVAVLLGLIYKNIFYAYVIGSTKDKSILNLRPIDLLYWNVIEWCSENGIMTFDWLGAGKPDKDYGVRDFKLQYGGNVLETGRYMKIHSEALYQISKFIFTLWQKLPK
jgi:serine/alanine adding enzyme